jgi:hypothetical protein
MAKFRYYLFDTYDNITGTNSRELARSLAAEQEYYVLDTSVGAILTWDDSDEPEGTYGSEEVQEHPAEDAPEKAGDESDESDESDDE